MERWGRYGAINGSFNNPENVAVDQTGNIYLADTGNNRIQVFSSNGTFISAWGRYAIGDTGLRSPEGIAVDSSGNVFVADTNNNRILVLSRLPISNVTFSSLFQ
jgi:DNA-binding beta-propeller fold protein YncE